MMIIETPTTVAILTDVFEFSDMNKPALQDRITLANDMNKKVVHCDIPNNLNATKKVAYHSKGVGSSQEVFIV
jgi:hypothetical protein